MKSFFLIALLASIGLVLGGCTNTVMDQDPSADVAAKMTSAETSSKVWVATIIDNGAIKLEITDTAVEALFIKNLPEKNPSDLEFQSTETPFEVKEYTSVVNPRNDGFFLTGFAFDQEISKEVWFRMKLTQDGNKLIAERDRIMPMRISSCDCGETNVQLVFDENAKGEKRPACYQTNAMNKRVGDALPCLRNRHVGYNDFASK